ncbi:hypothetical protein ACWEVY_05850 [Streptomyces longwoodensis]
MIDKTLPRATASATKPVLPRRFSPVPLMSPAEAGDISASPNRWWHQHLCIRPGAQVFRIMSIYAAPANQSSAVEAMNRALPADVR